MRIRTREVMEEGHKVPRGGEFTPYSEPLFNTEVILLECHGTCLAQALLRNAVAWIDESLQPF